MSLDEVVKKFGDSVSLEWRSFLLRPESTGMSQEEFVAYTQSWARPDEMAPSITFNQWSTDNPAPRSSVQAHVAAKLVEADQPKVSEQYHWALMKAYFTDNRDISDRATEAAVLDEVGGDGAALLAALDERYEVAEAQVRGDHAMAQELGITAVPTVVINGTMAVPGAQSAQAYETWISRILERS